MKAMKGALTTTEKALADMKVENQVQKETISTDKKMIEMLHQSVIKSIPKKPETLEKANQTKLVLFNEENTLSDVEGEDEKPEVDEAAIEILFQKIIDQKKGDLQERLNEIGF